MTGDLIALAVDFLARTVLLTLLLWVMIKLQKFDYVFISLLGAAALASGLDMIPHFGHYLALPVLYFCVWKITQSSLVPDAVFTVVIAYALMFLVNILLLTAFIGDLRPSARLRDEGEPEAETNTLSITAWREQTTPPPAADKGPPRRATARPASTNQSSEMKAAVAIAQNFTLKGITRNADKSMALIDTGVKTYSLYVGDLTTAKISGGSCHLRLNDVEPDYVTVEIDGSPVILKLH